MPVTVIDTIAPKNNGAWPVVEDVFMKGGWRVAASDVERDAIPAGRRKVGMRCYVSGSGLAYALVGGIENANWTLVSDGGPPAPWTIMQGLATQEDIIMAVDFATGISPPDGTVVRTQAEYNALGAPLKYCQDVFRILPAFVDHAVLVNVAAGNQYAPTDSFGTRTAFLSPLPLGQSNRSRNLLVPFTTRGYPGITFRGERTTVDPAIAGTFSLVGGMMTFTRTTGTWAVDEHNGKQVTVTSGANAGVMHVVRKTTATTLTFPFTGTAGAAVLDVVELSSVCINRINGGAATNYGIYDAGHFPNCHYSIGFEHLAFGTVAIPFGLSALTGRAMQFQNCRLTIDSAMAVVPSQGRSAFVNYFNCYFKLSASGYLHANRAGCGVRFTVFTGTSGNNWFLRLGDYAVVAYIDSVAFEPDAGYAGACLTIQRPCTITLSTYSEINGNGLCKGLVVEGGPSGTPEIIGIGNLAIKGCGTAVSVSYAHFHMNSLHINSTGNVNGWLITYGSVRALNFANVAVSGNAVSLGGTVYPYSLLAGYGDEITGPTGCSALMA